MKKKILYLLVASLLLGACEREDRKPRLVIGKGDIVTRTIDVNSFQRVDIVGFENLILSRGEPQILNIHAQDNIIDVISTEVKDGLLTIDYLPLEQERELLYLFLIALFIHPNIAKFQPPQQADMY